MTIPPYLKSGDKVAIISSAKRTEPEEIEQGLDLLKSWGLVPVMGRHTFKQHHFFAGTDEERAEDLQQALDDTSIKAIIFTKGAYGTMRIIDSINFEAFKKHPKWIVGYSDITILHQHIHHLDIESLHAVMLQGIPKSSSETIESLHKALFGEYLQYDIPQEPENRHTGNSVEGILVGGNLSIMYALIGTPSDIDTKDKILFIEDIDEYLYHLDRMMIALKRSGKLSGLKALIVGGMVDIKESTLAFGQSEREIILEHTKAFDYPVYFGFPSGHIPDNRALILGHNIRITPQKQSVSIEFLSPL
jgi:muramoyltetrapeptide carboxypeptidase